MDYKQSQRKWKAAQGLARHMWDINKKNTSNAATYKRLSKFRTQMPYRVNEKRADTLKGSKCGKDCNKLATRGYVKQALEKVNLGKEVTADSTGLTCGALVDYRLCKNIDKGVDAGDRQRGSVTLRGFRMFGTLTASATSTYPISVRFILLQDKTPNRPIREAFFSTISDSRIPVNFVDGTTVAPINLVRPLNSDRFVVKEDWVERVSNKIDLSGADHMVTFNRLFKFDRKITFGPLYNTAAEDLLPSYHLVYYPIHDNGSATDTVGYHYQYEEYFTD